MNFEYKITTDEYATAQALYHRLSGGRRRVQSATCWILAGSFFVVVGWNQRPIDWAQFLLAALGAWWIYAGIMSLLLPTRHFRRYYAASELAGKTFKADVNEDGFDVAGDICSWRTGWQGVRWKGENKRVFMFYSHGTVFAFGKQYLTSEQQGELRSLSGLGDDTV
jgi:hypothetical protein